MTDLDAPPVVGTRLGRYLFLREIAAGTFGPLYELRSEEEALGLSGLGRVINLSPELAPEAEEAIVASAWESLELRHEHALCVADVVFGKGWVTLVHDYTEGSLLEGLHARARERSSSFPIAVALRIISDVIEGLEQNRKVCETAGITWTPGGANTSSLYLCGDGRTRSLDGQLVFTLLRQDRSHARLSEALFSAPEAVSTDGQVDERTDVFAAATVLWQLLSGLKLSEGTAKSSNHTHGTLPKLNLALGKEAAKFPVGLARAVDSALELEPAKRPATLTAFKAALTRDREVASYAQVIDFTDALLHRESTLFRLTLDPEPKLSDELRSNKAVPAHHDWALELAKKARLAADAPRPTISAASKLAPAATTRMKAPTLTFPTTRTSVGAQQKKPATTSTQQPMQRAAGKSLNRTLLGISPLATAGQAVASVEAAAPLRIDIQPANVTEAISEVQRVAQPEPTAPVVIELARVAPPEVNPPAVVELQRIAQPEPAASTLAERTIESNSYPQALAESVATAFEISPHQDVTTHPALRTLPAEAPQEPLQPSPTEPPTAQYTTSTTRQDPVEDTFIRRKAVIQLTPLGITAWSFAMICLSALLTLALQRVLPSLSPAAPSVVVSTVASQSAAPAEMSSEVSGAQKQREDRSPAQPLATAEATGKLQDQPANAGQPATEERAAQPESAAQPSAKVAASAAPVAPKQYPKARKRRYIPRGL